MVEAFGHDTLEAHLQCGLQEALAEREGAGHASDLTGELVTKLPEQLAPLLIGQRAHGLSVEVKDVEDFKDDRGVGGDTATSAQAGGDGAEVGMAVGAEMDELGIEYEAVVAQRLAERLELGELAGGVAAGARAERKLPALSADLSANRPLSWTSTR